MASFYRQLDERTFDSLGPTAGPWSPHAQHAGPPAALLARAMERHEPAPGTRLADVRLDILGPIPVAPLTVDVTAAPRRSLDAAARGDGQRRRVTLGDRPPGASCGPRQLVPLLPDEEPSPWERALVLADSGGGIT